jgi:hypothetical protein
VKDREDGQSNYSYKQRNRRQVPKD